MKMCLVSSCSLNRQIRRDYIMTYVDIHNSHRVGYLKRTLRIAR